MSEHPAFLSSDQVGELSLVLRSATQELARLQLRNKALDEENALLKAKLAALELKFSNLAKPLEAKI